MGRIVVSSLLLLWVTVVEFCCSTIIMGSFDSNRRSHHVAVAEEMLSSSLPNPDTDENVLIDKDDGGGKRGAVELDSTTFYSRVLHADDTTSSTTNVVVWLIQFYAPYSEESIRMAPLLGRVAVETPANTNSRTTRIGKLDCSRFKPICAKQGIKKYPTMMYYDTKDKVFVDYPLPYHDEVAMKRFVERMAQPITMVETLEEAQAIAREEAQHGLVTFAGFNGHSDLDMYEVFEQAARNHAATSRFVWMTKTSREWANTRAHVMRLETGVTKDRTVSFSDPKDSFADLDAWVQKEQVPSCTDFFNDPDFALRSIATQTHLPWLLAVVGDKKQKVVDDMKTFVSENFYRKELDGGAHYFGIIDRSWTSVLAPFDLPPPTDQNTPQFITVTPAGYWHDPTCTSLPEVLEAIKSGRVKKQMKLPRKSVTGERGLHWTAELFLDLYPMSLGVALMLVAGLVVLCTNDPNASTVPRQQRSRPSPAQPSSSLSNTEKMGHRGKKDSAKKNE